MKMKKVVMCVVVGWMMLVSIQHVIDVAGAPVVFKDSMGQVCACISDGDVPTLAQCDGVDLNELHEVIHTSHCGTW